MFGKYMQCPVQNAPTWYCLPPMKTSDEAQTILRKSQDTQPSSPYVPLSKARLITLSCDELQKAYLVPSLTKVQKDGVTLWHSAPLQQHLGTRNRL